MKGVIEHAETLLNDPTLTVKERIRLLRNYTTALKNYETALHKLRKKDVTSKEKRREAPPRARENGKRIKVSLARFQFTSTRKGDIDG